MIHHLLYAMWEATEPASGALPWPFPQPVRYPAEDLKLLTDIREPYGL